MYFNDYAPLLVVLMIFLLFLSSGEDEEEIAEEKDYEDDANGDFNILFPKFAQSSTSWSVVSRNFHIVCQYSNYNGMEQVELE